MPIAWARGGLVFFPQYQAEIPPFLFINYSSLLTEVKLSDEVLNFRKVGEHISG